jgi:asparaginyl-tRNA synthetase
MEILFRSAQSCERGTGYTSKHSLPLSRRRSFTTSFPRTTSPPHPRRRPPDETTTTIKTKEIDKLTTGCSVHAIGRIVPSQGGKQSHELSAASLRIVGTCPGESYPLAKKRHTLEYLRTIAHLRPRTNTIAAISRVRSVLAGAIHAHFQSGGYRYVQTPLITASDCEGAGEMFRVTTLNVDDVDSLPRIKDEKTGVLSPGVDHAKDFFGKAAFLTVSGQLGGEAYATALGDIYTFGPTFRAENSQTARHLAEFWMVEPEMAFADLTSAMDSAESMLKYVVSRALEECDEDLTFFANFFDKGLRGRLEKLVNTPFVRLPYRDAIKYLQEEISKDPSKWQFPDVEFGTDLATEHERWLAETKFESAVFVYNYPKKIKAFYMRDNDDDGGETVNAMDLLVPGVGELVGGSQRVRTPLFSGESTVELFRPRCIFDALFFSCQPPHVVPLCPTL